MESKPHYRKDRYRHGSPGQREENHYIDTSEFLEEQHDAQTIKFILPMEPTESLDRTREYPPIVTVDGRVDTDIDHLMENPEEDFDDVPILDIPNKFPKPRVIRVIDGSLDDDIDNLMNHDGTMTHSLVDPPKQFNKSDLKEINSKKTGKKHNTPGPTNRSFNKMRQDLSDEEGPLTNAEVIPYSERNNSSNELLNNNAGFVFGQHDPNNPPPTEGESDKITIDDTVQGTKDEKGVDDTIQCSGERLSVNTENSGSKLHDTISTAPNTDANMADGMSKIMQQLLLQIPEQNMDMSPDTERDDILNSDTDSQTKETVEGNVEIEEGNGMPTNDVIPQTDVPEAEKSVELISDGITSELVGVENTSTVIDQLNEPNATMQDTMAMLKQILDNTMKTGEDNQTESQRALAVTALKVAGDSMTAAAKMADALTLLVKNSQPSLSTNQSDHLTRQIACANTSDVYNTRQQNEQMLHCSQNESSETVTSAEEKEMPNRRIVANEKLRRPKEITADMNKPYNALKKETESKRKSRMDTDDDADRFETKTHGHREAGDPKQEHFNDKSSPPLRREHRDKSHEKRHRHDERLPAKQETHRRSSRKREDKVDYENISLEKREELLEIQRRKEKEAKKKLYESDYKKKIKRNEKINDEPQHGEWTKHEDMKDRATPCLKADIKDIVKKYEKQMSSGLDSDRVNVDHHHRHRSQRERKFRTSMRKANQDIHDAKTCQNPEKPELSQDMIYHKDVSGDDDDDTVKKSRSSRKTNAKQSEFENFEKSDPWSLPSVENRAQEDGYFDHVVRRLKNFSPTREPAQPNPEREYIRSKLVGSCVDPYARDSDFDSIEFNGNARTSMSRVVRFHEESDSTPHQDDWPSL